MSAARFARKRKAQLWVLTQEIGRSQTRSARRFRASTIDWRPASGSAAKTAWKIPAARTVRSSFGFWARCSRSPAGPIEPEPFVGNLSDTIRFRIRVNS